MSDSRAHVDGLALSGVEAMNWIADVPSLGARDCPERAALIFPDRGQSLSYAQFENACNAFAGYLEHGGFKSGARVAYLGPNNDLFYAVMIGAIRARVVMVPINWRLAAPEIAFQLADARAELLVCDPASLALAQQAIAQSKLKLPLLPTEAGIESFDTNLRELLSQPAPAFANPHDADQIILQLYTSGTTGTPKGVLISHAALSLARQSEFVSPGMAHLQSGCVSLSAMPNFHIGGMSWVLMALIRQGTCVITADPAIGNLLKLIREYKVEHTWMVPTLIRALIDGVGAEGQPAPKLKGLYYGAMAMDEPLLRQAMDLFGCRFVQFFGMTENGGSAALLAPADHDLERPALLRSVGRPYPGMSIEIRNQQGEVLKPHEHGEIWVRSPTLMQGYWNLPDKTAEAVKDGWYASGDGGYLDDEGYLYLTDRIKDMIVSGGENVYPIEVERALRLHASIADAGVVGLPDARWGEVVVAVVELKPGAELDVEALRAHTRSCIASFKCPKTYLFDTLPRTASGKVQRSALKARILASGSSAS